MDEELNEIQMPVDVEVEEEILPDGWTEDTDIFSDEFIKAEPIIVADEPKKEKAVEDIQETVESPDEEPDELTKALEGQNVGVESGTEEEAKLTKQEESEGPKKLKFKAKIDHKEEAVEIDDSELPAIYQKAQVVDRVQDKLKKNEALLAKMEMLAKHLEYDDIEDFYNGTVDNLVEQRKYELMNEGVPEVVAEDMAKRGAEELRKNVVISPPKEEVVKERDYKAEVTELLAMHPELIGKSLPNEVTKMASGEGGVSVLKAYETYLVNKDKAELEALRKENKKLKQNAEAASRAPVRGVSKGGATNTEPDDDFLRGFESGW